MAQTEVERAQAMIIKCEAKRDAARDEASKWYYTMCIRGWQAWLEKCEREG